MRPRRSAIRSKLGKKAIRSKLGNNAVMSAAPMAANAPKVALGTNALDTAPAITPAREKS